MPALAFGLKPSRPGLPRPSAPQKRKAAFDDSEEQANGSDDDHEDAFSSLSTQKSQSQSRPQKSPRLTDLSSTSKPNALNTSNGSSTGNKYTNLSALRSAKLQDAAASKLDASVYDYDGVYDTFSAQQKKKSDADAEAAAATATVPKYMTNLLASAEVRKRDQLRAREKALQKERDAEGDEFADKERFVTSGYKAQQEEMRRIEEEERQREELEEEKRRKGEGMRAFHRDLLRKDEERSKALEEAAQQAQQTAKEEADRMPNEEEEPQAEQTDSKIAAELNNAGANIITNDDGEIVDKRQLLTAGLNVAPKKTLNAGPDAKNKATAAMSRPQDWQRTGKAQDARTAQRERQTRMMEKQIEEMEAKAREAEEAEKKELEEKNKSRLTETDKMSAKERYLQRKKEREEEAKKAKEKG